MLTVSENTLSFERGVFLALLVLLALLCVRLILNWPEPVVTEAARIDYREPAKVPEEIKPAGEDAFSGRDLLTPVEFKERVVKINAQEENRPQPRVWQRRPQPPRQNTGEVTLKPKTAPKPKPEEVKPAEVKVTERRLPLAVKGVVKTENAGFALLIQNANDETAITVKDADDQDTPLLREGTKFTCGGESFTIKKITADTTLLEMADGTVSAVKNDFRFAEAIEKLSGAKAGK